MTCKGARGPVQHEHTTLESVTTANAQDMKRQLQFPQPEQAAAATALSHALFGTMLATSMEGSFGA